MDISRRIVILFILCSVSFVLSLIFLICRLFYNLGLAVLLVGIDLLVVAFILFVIILIMLGKTKLNARNAETGDDDLSIQMDSPPLYEDVVRNPCAFPKTDQLTPNSDSISEVTNTIQSCINCSEAEGTSGDTRGSHSVNLRSHTDHNITLARAEHEDDDSPPPYCDVVAVASFHSIEVTI